MSTWTKMSLEDRVLDLNIFRAGLNIMKLMTSSPWLKPDKKTQLIAGGSYRSSYWIWARIKAWHGVRMGSSPDKTMLETPRPIYKIHECLLSISSLLQYPLSISLLAVHKTNYKLLRMSPSPFSNGCSESTERISSTAFSERGVIKHLKGVGWLKVHVWD